MNQHHPSTRRSAALTVLMLLFFTVTVMSPAASFEKGPVNPVFADWQAGKIVLDTDRPTGYVPSPVSWSHLQPTGRKDDLPAQFDLRDIDGVTPVKNQGMCGACWAFGACASLESWLKIHHDVTYDLSENHLKNNHGWELGHCDGGNNDMSTAYFARWHGPLLESEDPYNPNQNIPLDPTPPPQWLLLSAPVFSAAEGDRTDIQAAIMNYGAVSAVMHWASAYFNSSTNTYYAPGTNNPGNHMITVVGWDDARTVSGAPNPGAWICKNSYGTSWGEDGFFYLSYDDAAAVNEATGFFDLVPPDSYGRLYEHDPLGMSSHAGGPGEVAYGANVFTAVDDETIVAVGTYAVTNTTAYEIAVYDSGISGDTFVNPVVTTSGTFPYAGYHVIDLPATVSVSAGQTFSVRVRYETPGWDYPLPIETPIPDFVQPTASLGESYMSLTGNDFVDIHGMGGGWENTNACIKAIAATPAMTVRIVGRSRVEEGDSVVLNTLLPPLHGNVVFEWYKDDVLIVGAEEDAFHIPAATFDDSGWYHVIVEDESKGIYESDPFKLLVFPEGALPVSRLTVLIAAVVLVALGLRTRHRKRNSAAA